LLQNNHAAGLFAVSTRWQQSGHDFAPVAFEAFARRIWGSKNMSSVNFSVAGGSCPLVNKAFQWLGAALAITTLAACAQTSVTTGKFALSSTSRQASSQSRTEASFVSRRNGADTAKEQVLSAVPERKKETQGASFGLASTYGEGSQTASGVRFNASELTAAHRTLPFGTRVRVTNHSNGHSVVVTINDRGPFVSGRIIDVTPAAARALGMSGLAPVTIERE
jgi:rare lipoprotein A